MITFRYRELIKVQKQVKKCEILTVRFDPQFCCPTWNSIKTSYFEWAPLIKIGQITAKKCQNGLRRSQKMPFFIIWLRIMKIQNFSVIKMVFVWRLEPNWAKRNFLPQKRCSATFRWDPPFSIAFFWPQSSGFASNFRNLMRNCDFGRTTPARLTALQKNGKNQKTVLPDSFFWFDGFQSTK